MRLFGLVPTCAAHFAFGKTCFIGVRSDFARVFGSVFGTFRAIVTEDAALFALVVGGEANLVGPFSCRAPGAHSYCFSISVLSSTAYLSTVVYGGNAIPSGGCHFAVVGSTFAVDVISGGRVGDGALGGGSYLAGRR